MPCMPVSAVASNTNQEFCSFSSAPTPGNFQSNSWSAIGQFASNPFVNHQTFDPVNCARGGAAAPFWTDPFAPNADGSNGYNMCDARLASLGLAPNQVQIAWVKWPIPW